MSWSSPVVVTAEVAAVLGVGCGLIGNLLYLRDVRRGRTVPHRGSWLVWSAIGVLAAGAHASHGFRLSLVVLGVQASGSLAILGYALRRGVGGLTLGNAVLLTVAGAGIVGWQRSSDPVVAAVCAALADGAGLLAAVPKTLRDPTTETCATYGLAGAGGLCAVLSTGSTSPALLLFPAYYAMANTSFAYLIVRRRRPDLDSQPRASIGSISGTNPYPIP